MDSNQEAKLSMYIKVQQFLIEKLAVLTGLFSIITTYKTTLDDFIQDIFDADAIATADTTGYTEAKQEKRDEMTELALRISGAGAAYYKTLGDSGSQNEIYFVKTEFTLVADTIAYTRAMQVHRLANAAGAALAPHGITVGDISNLNVVAQQYLALLELPKNKIAAKAAQGLKVESIMSDTDDFLNETLDPQMRVLKGTADNELFDEYNFNRGIDDAPSGGSNLTNVVVEGDALIGSINDIDTSGFTVTESTTITVEITLNEVMLSAAPAPGPTMGPTVWHVFPGTQNKTLDAFNALVGADETNTFLKVQCTGPLGGHYKITFNNVQE